MKKVFFILCMLVLQAPIFAQQEKTTNLNDEEKAIIAYIDQNMPRAIALLKESVNINSGTLNIEGVKKVGALFAKEFEKKALPPWGVSSLVQVPQFRKGIFQARIFNARDAHHAKANQSHDPFNSKLAWYSSVVFA